jgi:hypothetical protein
MSVIPEVSPMTATAAVAASRSGRAMSPDPGPSATV